MNIINIQSNTYCAIFPTSLDKSYYHCCFNTYVLSKVPRCKRSPYLESLSEDMHHPARIAIVVVIILVYVRLCFAYEAVVFFSGKRLYN